MITTVLAPMVLGGFQSTSIDSYLNDGIKDVTFNVSVLKRNIEELRKIDTSFVQQFGVLDSATFRCKEPFKLRFDGRSEDNAGYYVINGPTKLISVPALRVKQKINISTQPGQRQTMMDFILLTEADATQFLSAKFVRFDRETGNPIFDLTFPSNLNYPVRHRVWLDKNDHYMVRREWYGLKGQLRATYYYGNPVKVKGISVPTSFRLVNAENKVAAELKYTGVKVNDGIADSVFAI